MKTVPMGIDDKTPCHSQGPCPREKAAGGEGRGGRALRVADCAEARQGVEAARHTLPTIVYSTLLRRVEQCEQLLAQQGR